MQLYILYTYRYDFTNLVLHIDTHRTDSGGSICCQPLGSLPTCHRELQRFFFFHSYCIAIVLRSPASHGWCPSLPSTWWNGTELAQRMACPLWDRGLAAWGIPDGSWARPGAPGSVPGSLEDSVGSARTGHLLDVTLLGWSNSLLKALHLLMGKLCRKSLWTTSGWAVVG